MNVRQSWPQFVGALALAAIGAAVLYPSYLRANESTPSLQEGVAHLGRLHQAFTMYGEAHEVWDELPGMGRISPRLLRNPMSALPYFGSAGTDALYSPASPRGIERIRLSSYTYRPPLSTIRPTPVGPHISTAYEHALAEFEGERGGYRYLSDFMFDTMSVYPAEMDQSLGALVIEATLDGQVRVVRRKIPRMHRDVLLASIAAQR